MTFGGSGMYAIMVVLPQLQKEFGTGMAGASLPWLLTTLGFGFGAIAVGRISDRHGIFLPSIGGAIFLGIGFVAAAHAQSLWALALIQGIVISMLGGAASFLPLVADVSHWFARRRGLAMSICVSGNFAAGALWPPVLQYLFDTIGWRAAFTWVGIGCMVAMLPLTFFLVRRSPVGQSLPPSAEGASTTRPLGFKPNTLQALLGFAGFCCCVAMAVPQVHIVAYCTTLGYGAVNGAHMLALMLAAGIVSRVALGWLSDRIGGLRTLLLGSSMQAVALTLYVPFDSLGSLFAISLLFGFFQGGVVPSYALIIREYFSAADAGTRTGIVLTVALFGMGIGGWAAGWIYDLSASYRYAFLLGMVANVINISIVLWLIARSMRLRPAAAYASA